MNVGYWCFFRFVFCEFNLYGFCCGNDVVMVCGMFVNIRLVNKFIGKVVFKIVYIFFGDMVW